MHTPARCSFTILLTSLLLVACSDQTAQSPALAPVVEDSSVPAAAPADYAEFNTSATIRDVMNTLIDPNADAIWNAVRFELDETGEREVFPVTDEEWQLHRRQAIAMIEGANSLMIPGRRVAPPGATTDFPEYEFLPEEVEAKLREDRQSWITYAQGFQASVQDVIAAIDARDVDRLSETAGLVDAQCESCHSQYWYRSGN